MRTERTHRLGVRVSREEHDAMEAAARRRGLTLSEYLRRTALAGRPPRRSPRRERLGLVREAGSFRLRLVAFLAEPSSCGSPEAEELLACFDRLLGRVVER